MTKTYEMRTYTASEVRAMYVAPKMFGLFAAYSLVSAILYAVAR